MADVFSEFSLPVAEWTAIATNVTSIAIQLSSGHAVAVKFVATGDAAPNNSTVKPVRRAGVIVFEVNEREGDRPGYEQVAAFDAYARPFADAAPAIINVSAE